MGLRCACSRSYKREDFVMEDEKKNIQIESFIEPRCLF